MWKTYHVILIPKNTNQDFSLLNSRPISLESNMLKLVEMVVMERMLAETAGLRDLPPHIIGHRKGVSLYTVSLYTMCDRA
jgi:hypothetical protein